MASKWAETGILRKKQSRENFDDLLVFGYACKLFRDDERALYVDQGKHLIPWMGDDRVKIDRYDARGTLSDIASYEAARDATHWLGLSETERKVEQLCDEERYYSLHNDEHEIQIYKEEEKRRQNSNQFHYSYDVPTNDDGRAGDKEDVPTCEDEDKPFVPKSELAIPVGIDIPKTVKENARIEKTALFISQQGPQMEILIKAKQNDNPQFNFMTQSDPLHKYYRHLLNAIKSGQYIPEDGAVLDQDKNGEASNPLNSTGPEYLHPDLAKNATAAMNSITPTVLPMQLMPTVPYKPAADCAYTQLVSRIKGTTTYEKEKQVPACEAQSTSNNEPMQNVDTERYYQLYHAQYYQYYQQLAQQYATQGNCDIHTVMQNSQLQEQFQQQAMQYAQAACAQYALPANPPALPEPSTVTEQKLSLVHYSSNSEDDNSEAECEESVTPPEDVAIIIDKMAVYVSKNGPNFEESVKRKGDARFEFLHEHHRHYKYYKRKLTECAVPEDDASQKQSYSVTQSAAQPEDVRLVMDVKVLMEKSQDSRTSVPVSFSFKKIKDECAKDIKCVVRAPDECTTPPPPAPAPAATATHVPEPAADAPPAADGNGVGKSFPGDVDPIFEMIDLTEDCHHDAAAARDPKALIIERIKGKMAAASIVRERALQLERKKRAALFLQMHSEDTREVNRSRSRSRRRRSRSSSRKPEKCSREKKSSRVSHSESELEDGEIKRRHRSRSRHKTRKKSHKKSSKSRNTSKSRHHRKHRKKTKSSPPPTSTATDTD